MFFETLNVQWPFYMEFEIEVVVGNEERLPLMVSRSASIQTRSACSNPTRVLIILVFVFRNVVVLEHLSYIHISAQIDNSPHDTSRTLITMASLLQNYVDADQWEAEDDVVGRLGMVAHAAFLFAGFVPYGAQPPSGYLLKQRQPAGESKGSRCLSRLYTAPQLAHREAADAAVLLLVAQGSHVALLVYLTTDDDARSPYRERVDVAALTPLLSRALDDTEPRGSRACWSLGNGVCWGFLHELCRRNGLPLAGFTSVPDDVKAEILMRVTDGADLARVECASQKLRSLVADRGLWKPLCESWNPLYEPLGKLHVFEEIVAAAVSKLVSWKAKYVTTRRLSHVFILLMDGFPDKAVMEIERMIYPTRPTSLSDVQPKRVARGSSAECQRHQKVLRTIKKRPQGFVALRCLPHSPYRWKHRCCKQPSFVHRFCMSWKQVD
jgi:hypothetical protein